MFRVTLQTVLCGLIAANIAVADRDIVLLSGNADKVIIYDADGLIYITDGDPNTFVFECFDDVTGEPANIEFIGTSGSPSGTITVSILPGNGHTYGAASIWEVALSGGGFAGQIEEIYISGNLATEGDVVCDNITGDLDIGGNLGKIGLPYTTLSAGTVAGTITINGTLVSGDSIEVGTLGDLTIYGSGATPVQGDITITNSYAGTLLIDHKFGGEIDLGSALTGTISITGVTTGVVNVDGNVSGAILVDANLNKPGRIVIGGSVSQANATVPAVRITAGVVGSIVLEKCSGLRTRRTLRPGALCD